MGIAEFFKLRFRKKVQSAGFLKQALISIKTLCEKAENLGPAYSGEKEQLWRIYDDLNKVKPEENPTAIKFEHTILEKATLSGSLCDKAIIGKDSGEFKNSVQLLGNSVNQRKNFENSEG